MEATEGRGKSLGEPQDLMSAESGMGGWGWHGKGLERIVGGAAALREARFTDLGAP